jgi:hypothetical protein
MPPETCCQLDGSSPGFAESFITIDPLSINDGLQRIFERFHRLPASGPKEAHQTLQIVTSDTHASITTGARPSGHKVGSCSRFAAEFVPDHETGRCLARGLQGSSSIDLRLPVGTVRPWVLCLSSYCGRS